MEEGEQLGLRALLRVPVRDANAKEIGHLEDLAVRRDLARPDVTGVGVHLEWTDRVGKIELVRRIEDLVVLVPWSAVREIGGECVALGDEHPRLRVESAADRWLLRQDVLDKQMLDSEGRRLQRVDDVVLRRGAGGLEVAGLEVSGGLMTSSRVKRLVSRLRSQHPAVRDADFIPWEAVRSVDENSLVIGGSLNS